MPRASIASSEAWRAEFRAQQEQAALSAERFVQFCTNAILLLMTLYLMVGSRPFARQIEFDAETGAAAQSPINRYIWMVLGAMCAPVLWARRDQLIPLLKRIWPVILIYVWFAASTTWAIDPQVSNRRLFLYVINLVIAVTLTLGFGAARKLHRSLVMACMTMVGIDFLATTLMHGASMTELGLAGIHTHKNTMGQVMMLCALAIGPYCIRPPEPRNRWIWIVGFVTCFGMLVLTQSKTSLAILVVTMAVTPLLMFVLNMRPQTIRAILSTIFAMILTLLLGWVAYCMAAGESLLGPLKGISFTQRTDLWAFVFTEILKRPLTGSGFGSFWDINPLLQPSRLLGDPTLFVVTDTNQSHNGYLDLLVTTGLIGLGLCLFQLFRWIFRGFALIRHGLQDPRSEEGRNLESVIVMGLFPSLVFVHNFMESSYFSPSSILGPLVLLFGIGLDLYYARMKGVWMRKRQVSPPPRARLV